MNTIKANDFLESKDFTFAKDYKLEKFDPTKLEDFSNINVDTIEFIKSEALDALLKASLTSDKTDTPSTPSFQPLNEAGILTSGEALDKSSISSITNNSMGIQEDASESLANTAQFAQGTNFNPTEESLAAIKEAQETLATGVKSLANRAELANSGIKFAGGKIEFGGNNISMGTDTAFHITSPIINTVADVENKQAKTIQETTNQKTLVAKNTFTQVEGLQSTVAQNSMKTVTQSNVQISNYNSTTALEKNITNSNQIENIAGEYIKNRSTNAITNEANGIISNQSPNISLVAAEGSKSPLGTKEEIGSKNSDLIRNEDGSLDISTKDPSGKVVKFKNVKPDTSTEKWKSVGGLEGQSKDKIKPTQEKKGGGNLSILADGQGGTVSIINKNMVMSSTGNQNISVGGNYNQVAQGSVTTSAAFVNTEADAGLTMSGTGYIRTQSGSTGTFISNGFTFAGYRFPALKKFIDKASNVPLEIREIPALSNIPLVVGIKTLEDCLPKKYTEPNNPDEILDEEAKKAGIPDEIAAPTKKEARRRNKPAPTPVGKNTTNAEGGLIQAAQGISNSKKTDGNTILGDDKGPTDSNPVPKNKLTSAAAVFKGGSDVYSLDDEEAFDLFERQGKEIIDPDASEESGGPKLTRDLIKSLSELSITNASIQLNQKPDIIKTLTSDLNAVKNYYYDKLLTDKTLITEAEKYTDKNKEFIEKAIKVKETKELLDLIEKELISRSSTGGALSFITSAYEKVNSSISIASNILEQGSKRNEFEVLKGAAELAKNITNDEIFTDISNIINSSESLSNIYGQVNNIIKDKNITTGEVIDKISFDDVQNVISQGLNTIGIDNLEKATSIARILNKIKNSPEYKKDGLTTQVKEDLIFDIIDQTGLTNTQARTIYTEAESVIASILKGDVRDLVEGSELQNILGYFIGSSNAAILTDLKDIYLKGSGIIAQGQGLFNQGKDLYQDGKELYATLQSVPALVGLMNEYEIPLLNQAKIVLQCLELISKVQNIIDGIKQASQAFKEFGTSIDGTLDAFKDLLGGDSIDENATPLEKITDGLIKGDIATKNIPTSNNEVLTDELPSVINQEDDTIIINSQSLNSNNCSTVIFSYAANTNDSSNPSQWSENISEIDAIDLIEKLPRLTQIYNSIKELPKESINIIPELNEEQITAIQNTEIVKQPDSCFIAPKLNLLEAKVKIIEIKDNIILYKMEYINSLYYNTKDIFPSNNTIVQIYCNEFYNNKTQEFMNVIRTKEFFSPNIYSFKTTVFDKDKNLGIGYLMNSQTRIHLASRNNIPYNYSITDIGKKLIPTILDSYIVA